MHQVTYAKYPILAFLDDMALLTMAFVDLYEVSGHIDYLNKANICLNEILENFNTKNLAKRWLQGD